MLERSATFAACSGLIVACGAPPETEGGLSAADEVVPAAAPHVLPTAESRFSSSRTG